MTVRLTPMNYYATLATLIASIALIEYGGIAGNPGALLVTLVWWTGLLQGAIAVVAISDLLNTKWIKYLRHELLSMSRLLIIPPALFLLFLPQMDKYPWFAKPPHLWLDPSFFFWRNLIVLLICYGLGRVFAQKSINNAPDKVKWGVFYLFAFAACQNLVAVDWIMSLEWPWFSTLFGPFFAIESIYTAFIFSAFLFCISINQKKEIDPIDAPLRMGDIGTLIYGFSILWGGFFFAQFLLIWYGNLPEEVGYIVTRINDPFTPMAYAFVIMVFALPFALLTPGENKRKAKTLIPAAILVTFGLFTEKTLYVVPVIPFDRGILILENSLLVAVLMLVIHSRDLLLVKK